MDSRAEDGRHEFDFLFGRWRVHNRRLRRRLVGDREWLEFETLAEARPILSGLGNIDGYRGDVPGVGAWEGFTLRLFDPASRVWRIWWASTAQPGHLDAPMIGRFDNGFGVFYGDDVVDRRAVRVRFLWLDVATDSPRWEQAFSVDGEQTWETNWVMTFERSR